MSPRVLVVDDEPQLRRVLVRFFARLGFAVDAAGDGLEALDLLERRTYDLVLCDVRMPNLDGLSTFHAAQERLGGLPPWVFLTGYADHSDRRLLDQGATRVFTKPTPAADLVALVQELGLSGDC